MSATAGSSSTVSVVVPAHDEGRVIDRLLAGLLAGCPADAVEVVVVANGCTDDTAQRARSYAVSAEPPLTVLELPEPSKVAAIRAGLAHATGDVVAVVDADVRLDWPTLREVAARLRASPGPLVGAPAVAVDTDGCPWPVRSYFRVWTQLPYVRSAMVGSGVFAVNAAGRDRLDRLPEVLNDDAWVRRSFPPDERVTGPGSFTTFAPRSVLALVRRRTRVDLGNVDLDRLRDDPPAAPNGMRYVLAAAKRGELLRRDAATFVAVTLATRGLAAWRRHRGTTQVWSQDRTSRAATAGRGGPPRD
jgi:glycosyltransferase involved in cell wall biosynthesis